MFRWLPARSFRSAGDQPCIPDRVARAMAQTDRKPLLSMGLGDCPPRQMAEAPHPRGEALDDLFFGPVPGRGGAGSYGVRHGVS